MVKKMGWFSGSKSKIIDEKTMQKELSKPSETAETRELLNARQVIETQLKSLEEQRLLLRQSSLKESQEWVQIMNWDLEVDLVRREMAQSPKYNSLNTYEGKALWGKLSDLLNRKSELVNKVLLEDKEYNAKMVQSRRDEARLVDELVGIDNQLNTLNRIN
jgi:hypothetical protein